MLPDFLNPVGRSNFIQNSITHLQNHAASNRTITWIKGKCQILRYVVFDCGFVIYFFTEFITDENVFNLGNVNNSNADNLNNVRQDASRHFRNKKKAYLRAKAEELETNSKINNIRDLYRGINDMKKGY